MTNNKTVPIQIIAATIIESFFCFFFKYKFYEYILDNFFFLCYKGNCFYEDITRIGEIGSNVTDDIIYSLFPTRSVECISHPSFSIT